MGFDEPKPFVYATRDFREHIRGISILQLVRLINGLADFASEGGQRFANGFDVRVTVGNVEVILFQARAFRGQPRSALRNATELNNAFRDQINISFHSLVNFVEQFMQTDEVGAFDIQCACFICI